MMVRMSVIYLAGRYGASAITLFALSIYTRLASPHDYGFYALVMAFATALYAAFGQWLRHVLLRFCRKEMAGRASVPALVFQSFHAIAIVLAIVALLLSPWLNHETRQSLILALSLMLAMGCFELALAWLQLNLLPSLYVGLSILRTSLAAFLGVIALTLGFGAVGLVIATIFAYAFAAFPAFIKTGFGLGSARPAFAQTRSMLAYGLPLALSATLVSALALADRALIAGMISTEAAGLYAAPYDLATRTLQVMMLAINLAGTPLIIRAFESGDQDQTDFLLARQWIMLVIAGLPVTLGMMLMPYGIASILLGSSFRLAGGELMPYVALATFLQGLESFYFSFSFALTKNPLRQTFVLLLATLVNIGLTIFLIPVYGIVGGAWATLASSVLVFLGSMAVGFRLRRLPLAPRDILLITLSAAPMALILVVANPRQPFETLMIGTLGFAVYVIALFSTDVAGLRRGLIRTIRLRLAPSHSAGETL